MWLTALVAAGRIPRAAWHAFYRLLKDEHALRHHHGALADPLHAGDEAARAAYVAGELAAEGA